MTEKIGKTKQHMEKVMILGYIIKQGTGETVV